MINIEQSKQRSSAADPLNFQPSVIEKQRKRVVHKTCHSKSQQKKRSPKAINRQTHCLGEKRSLV